MGLFGKKDGDSGMLWGKIIQEAKVQNTLMQNLQNIYYDNKSRYLFVSLSVYLSVCQYITVLHKWDHLFDAHAYLWCPMDVHGLGGIIASISTQRSIAVHKVLVHVHVRYTTVIGRR